MLDFLAGLGGQGYGASLVCTSVPVEIAEKGLPFPVTTWNALGGRWTGFISAGTFREFLRRTEADVIHVHGTGLGFSGRRFLRAARAPLVFTPYSLNGDRYEAARIGRRAACVIALSEFMREGLVNRSRIPRETLRLVTPGVDLKLYDFLPPRIGERVPVVGAVAPLEPERGQSVFLRAVKILAASVREAEFIVAGDGREERSLRREAAALGVEKRVTFVPGLANYRGAIAAVDIFVRPSLSGGFGYGVLEAMAMGKAVVATSAGSVPEMVVEGKTARLVAKGDAAALAEAVGQLLTHPQAARELGAAARRSVSERFSMQRVVAETVSVYAEAVEEMKT
jgi:glycosyltransferase involved in cell wall biosynthesis